MGKHPMHVEQGLAELENAQALGLTTAEEGARKRLAAAGLSDADVDHIQAEARREARKAAAEARRAAAGEDSEASARGKTAAGEDSEGDDSEAKGKAPAGRRTPAEVKDKT